jgi:hypothetical protein
LSAREAAARSIPVVGALQISWPSAFHILERRRVPLAVGNVKAIADATTPVSPAGSVIERESRRAFAYCAARMRGENNEEGHGAPSRASVAKGVLLRHEKYPTS